MPKWLSANFTLAHGEITPELEWRRDLQLYYGAARRVENALPLMGGGVMRRPGTRYLTVLLGQHTVVPFVFDENERHLIELTDNGWRVLDCDGTALSTGTDAPWLASDTMRWAILGDVIVLTIRGKRAQILRRTAYGVFSREDFAFSEIETANGKRLGAPHAYIESKTVELKPSAATGAITVTASAALFDTTWVGERIRIKDREIEITAVTDSTKASATVHESLVDTAWTSDWTRAAISAKAGWPESALFFAGRLWLAGAPLLPYRVFGSRVGDWFRFDHGDGNDDDAIAVDISGENIQRAVHLIGRDDLFVLTNSRVFALRRTVDGAFTPKNSTFVEAGATGAAETVPVIYDDAVVFASNNGRAISEVVWDSQRETHAVSTMSLLARHLVIDPVNMGEIRLSDRPERMLGIVMASGEMMLLFSLRQEQRLFASRWSTDGSFKQILPLGRETLAVVERNGAWLVERFETDSKLDSSVHQTSAVTDISVPWLAGDRIMARSGWSVQYDGLADGGAVSNSLFSWEEAGLPFALLVETLPVDGVLVEAPIPHRVKRIHTMNLRVIGAVGLDFQAGAIVRTKRLVSPLDVDEPNTSVYDGLVRYHMLGAGREMTVTVSSEAPSPLQLLGWALEATI